MKARHSSSSHLHSLASICPILRMVMQSSALSLRSIALRRWRTSAFWMTERTSAGPDRGSPSPRKDDRLSSILAHKRLDSNDPPFLGELCLDHAKNRRGTRGTFVISLWVPIQGAFSVSHIAVGHQCHLVSQAMGSPNVAEPMLRQTDRETNHPSKKPPCPKGWVDRSCGGPHSL